MTDSGYKEWFFEKYSALKISMSLLVTRDVESGGKAKRLKHNSEKRSKGQKCIYREKVKEKHERKNNKNYRMSRNSVFASKIWLKKKKILAHSVLRKNCVLYNVHKVMRTKCQKRVQKSARSVCVCYILKISLMLVQDLDHALQFYLKLSEFHFFFKVKFLIFKINNSLVISLANWFYLY